MLSKANKFWKRLFFKREATPPATMKSRLQASIDKNWSCLCGGSFFGGPTGGMCENFKCDACGCRVNMFMAGKPQIVDILQEPNEKTII